MAMPEWLNFVDEKRRVNFVKVLSEISRLQDKKDLNFIIIGAVSLLMQGYLKYIAYWDIDLLFKNAQRLKEFINHPKSQNLRIINYDDELMISEKITSFHTAWSFTKTWFNVDYILREGIFEFYTENLSNLKPYTTIIELKEGKFPIELYLAHPWDLFVEKVLSPRVTKDIELKVDMSIDIRHIYIIYNREVEDQSFWDYVVKKIKGINKEEEFKTKLLTILNLSEELGYEKIIPPQSVTNLLK
uniref:Nucleotidyl transferase AbiEii/AbiGii toxin family protein n=1 Tax=candidate division WOR-3 bacterium TaxID=2052148 RepID=A0A7V3RGN7_UNCW3